MIEEWRQVPGYENILLVSNTGKVKRVNYRNSGKDRVLSVQVKKYNICTINIRIDKKLHTLSVHRLVASAFIPNPNNLPCVNHLDENRLNNNANNLEWCNYEYNNNYMTRNRRISQSKINGLTSKPILQYDLQGNLIKEWPSIAEIQRQLGFATGNISCCAKGKYHHNSAYGYVWRYKN